MHLPVAMTRRTVLSLLPTLPLLRAETTQDRGHRIVKESIAALGGDAFLGIRNRIETGRAYSFYRSQLRGLAQARIYTEYLSKGDAATGKLAYRERQNFGPKEDTGVLFNEEDGYELTFRGARPLPLQQVQRHREGGLHNIFYIFRERLNEPGISFEGLGADVLDNQPVETVEIADAENNKVIVAFHRTSKLPIKQTYYSRDSDTKERLAEVTIYNKYRDVGGIQWPYNILRERDGEKVFELFSENVQVNQNLPEKLFSLQRGVPMLKRESS